MKRSEKKTEAFYRPEKKYIYGTVITAVKPKAGPDYGPHYPPPRTGPDSALGSERYYVAETIAFEKRASM